MAASNLEDHVQSLQNHLCNFESAYMQIFEGKLCCRRLNQKAVNFLPTISLEISPTLFPESDISDKSDQESDNGNDHMDYMSVAEFFSEYFCIIWKPILKYYESYFCLYFGESDTVGFSGAHIFETYLRPGTSFYHNLECLYTKYSYIIYYDDMLSDFRGFVSKYLKKKFVRTVKNSKYYSNVTAPYADEDPELIDVDESGKNPAFMEVSPVTQLTDKEIKRSISDTSDIVNFHRPQVPMNWDERWARWRKHPSFVRFMLNPPSLSMPRARISQIIQSTFQPTETVSLSGTSAVS